MALGLAGDVLEPSKSQLEYESYSPEAKQAVDQAYGPGGIMEGHNIVSAFGEGVQATIQSRIDTIDKANTGTPEAAAKREELQNLLNIIDPAPPVSVIDPSQPIYDDTDPADIGFASEADQAFAETGDYDVYSDVVDTGPIVDVADIGAEDEEPTAPPTVEETAAMEDIEPAAPIYTEPVIEPTAADWVNPALGTIDPTTGRATIIQPFETLTDEDRESYEASADAALANDTAENLIADYQQQLDIAKEQSERTDFPTSEDRIQNIYKTHANIEDLRNKIKAIESRPTETVDYETEAYGVPGEAEPTAPPTVEDTAAMEDILPIEEEPTAPPTFTTTEGKSFDLSTEEKLSDLNPDNFREGDYEKVKEHYRENPNLTMLNDEGELVSPVTGEPIDSIEHKEKLEAGTVNFAVKTATEQRAIEQEETERREAELKVAEQAEAQRIMQEQIRVAEQAEAQRVAEAEQAAAEQAAAQRAMQEQIRAAEAAATADTGGGWDPGGGAPQAAPSAPSAPSGGWSPGVGGGNGGGGNGCFLPATPITMADGSTKPVKDVDLGDEVAKGGKVFAAGRFLIDNLYDYKGIKVSGSHMVNEDDKWTRIENSKHGKSLGDNEHTVYVFGAENRRILIKGILFTDYFELPEQEQLDKNGDKWSNQWREYTQKIEKQNVAILNASQKVEFKERLSCNM